MFILCAVLTYVWFGLVTLRYFCSARDSLLQLPIVAYIVSVYSLLFGTAETFSFGHNPCKELLHEVDH